MNQLNRPLRDDLLIMALELAAVAIGRLDAALSGSPLLPAWTFWTGLDTARRHAEADGRRVNLHRLAAYLYGLPLKLDPALQLAERGSDISALAYAVELRSWLIHPDAGQEQARAAALETLRQTGAGHPALIGAALGLHRWLRELGERAPVRAALPLYLQERGLIRRHIPALSGSDALKAGSFERDEFALRVIRAFTSEAEDGLALLGTLEREWREARNRVGQRARQRSTSRLPRAVDLLAASPLLSVTALAQALGCSVEGASQMLDELVRLEIAAEVTGMSGRGVRRLYGLGGLLPIRGETTAARRRPKGGPRGRPKKILVSSVGDLPALPSPDSETAAEPARLAPLSFDFEALDRLVAAADERTRSVRRLLTRAATGEPQPTTPKPDPAPDGGTEPPCADGP